MVLHVVILGGGFLVATLGSPLIPLALLVVLKTGWTCSGIYGSMPGRSPPPRPISSAWSKRPFSVKGLTRKCSDWRHGPMALQRVLR